jgi:hypothetical protein
MLFVVDKFDFRLRRFIRPSIIGLGWSWFLDDVSPDIAGLRLAVVFFHTCSSLRAEVLLPQ